MIPHVSADESTREFGRERDFGSFGWEFRSIQTVPAKDLSDTARNQGPLFSNNIIGIGSDNRT